jgi:hypothetical protein
LCNKFGAAFEATLAGTPRAERRGFLLPDDAAIIIERASEHPPWRGSAP